MADTTPSFIVTRAAAPLLPPSADWDAPHWAHTASLSLERWGDVREGLEYRPQCVEAKLQASDECLAVLFRVSDEVVKTEATEFCGAVWKDSCVEMFISPGQPVASTSNQYFNFEMNASGVLLLYHCRGGTESTPVSEEDAATIQIAATAGPAPILPDQDTEPQSWSVEYHVPWALFAKHFDTPTPPTGGTVWTANFYKCGGPKPHYGNWSPLLAKRAGQMGAFHSPESFGQLCFDDTAAVSL